MKATPDTFKIYQDDCIFADPLMYAVGYVFFFFFNFLAIPFSCFFLLFFIEEKAQFLQWGFLFFFFAHEKKEEWGAWKRLRREAKADTMKGGWTRRRWWLIGLLLCFIFVWHVWSQDQASEGCVELHASGKLIFCYVLSSFRFLCTYTFYFSALKHKRTRL